MRHVSRTHRVALVWLFDRTNMEPKIQIKYVDTKNQHADIFNRRKFLQRSVESPCTFVQHHEFSDFSRSHFQKFLSHSRERLSNGIAIGTMSKRGQDASSSDGSPLAKARPTIFVTCSQCKEDISKQRLGSMVNPETINRKELSKSLETEWQMITILVLNILK